jgi:hypothetical protein
LAIEFSPLHDLEMSSSIIIQVDRDIFVTCPTSFEYNSDQLDISSVDCDFSTTPASFTFPNPFKQEYSYISGEHNVLRIVFDEAKMPRAKQVINELIIQTVVDDGAIVDLYNSSDSEFFTV